MESLYRHSSEPKVHNSLCICTCSTSIHVFPPVYEFFYTSATFTGGDRLRNPLKHPLMSGTKNKRITRQLKNCFSISTDTTAGEPKRD